MKKINICSVSGGKDSTALYCLMVEIHGQDFLPLFADTGHEHPVTLNYVRNLPEMAGGPPIVVVKPDFKTRLERKGIESTGNSFLDMSLWKGRAPSTKAQFCTEHLKLWPILFYLEKNYPRTYFEWIMHTGIRAGESARRSKMQPFSWNGFYSCYSVLPLLYESEQDIFSFLELKGVPPNPLYQLGYGRVGCFPCVHANKKELSLLPDWAWDRLEWYEKNIGRSFFSAGTVPGIHIPTVADVREWCRTSHGGSQYNMFRIAPEDAPSCMTGWSQCE